VIRLVVIGLFSGLLFRFQTMAVAEPGPKFGCLGQSKEMPESEHHNREQDVIVHFPELGFS
jgi:hypothetical protein